MLLAYFTLFSGLLISAVAIYYSVAGLMSIFSATVVPIIIMGASLEVGKLVGTVWLKQNWKIAPFVLKAYLIFAIVILMIITSIGTFGFLSQSHIGQSLVTDNSAANVAVYDEKIQIQKDNIKLNRESLAQLDLAVNQLMSRSDNMGGIAQANAARRNQKAERELLLSEIASAQHNISVLNDDRAPLAATLRKNEADVGPIKYVAALLYGDDPDQNILDKAVRWVIVLIVIVFDPLAVILLLASQYSFDYLRKKREHHTAKLAEIAAAPKEEEAIEVPDTVENSEAPPIPPYHYYYSTTTTLPVQSHDEDTHEEVATTPANDHIPVVDMPSNVADEITTDSEIGCNEPVDTPLDSHEPTVDDTTPIAATQPHHVIVVLSEEYISVDGQTYHHKAYDRNSKNAQHAADRAQNNGPTSMYVQNEEQINSNAWSQINHAISEDEYLKLSEAKK